MKYWNTFWFYFNLFMAIVNASQGSQGYTLLHIGLAYLFYITDNSKKEDKKDENNRSSS